MFTIYYVSFSVPIFWYRFIYLRSLFSVHVLVNFTFIAFEGVCKFCNQHSVYFYSSFGQTFIYLCSLLGCLVVVL